MVYVTTVCVDMFKFESFFTKIFGEDVKITD